MKVDGVRVSALDMYRPLDTLVNALSPQALAERQKATGGKQLASRFCKHSDYAARWAEGEEPQRMGDRHAVPI